MVNALRDEGRVARGEFVNLVVEPDTLDQAGDGGRKGDGSLTAIAYGAHGKQYSPTGLTKSSGTDGRTGSFSGSFYMAAAFAGAAIVLNGFLRKPQTR